MAIPFYLIMLFLAEIIVSNNNESACLIALIGRFLYLAFVIYLWVTWEGRTIGKKMMGTKIVSYPDYQEISTGTAVIRMIGYSLSGLLFGLGYLMIAFREDKRGLHDLLAGTCVIYDKNNGKNFKSKGK